MSSTVVPNILTSGTYVDEGDVAKVTILTKNAAGNLADPSTLVVKVQPIGGTTVTYTYGTDGELTKSTTGTYILLHPVTSGMDLQVRTITTGDIGAEPGYIPVRPSNITV